MSDPAAKSRPVSVVTVLAVLALFALFLLVVDYAYLRKQTGVATDDGIHTAEQRLKNLTALREKQAQQLSSYGWVDQKAHVVQLPIDRAMELTAQQYGAKK